MNSKSPRLGRWLPLAAIFFAVPAIAGPDSNGCYENHWFDPFLIGISCTHPALGDPDHTTPTIATAPQREPPACPYDHPGYTHNTQGAAQWAHDQVQHAQDQAQEQRP